MQIIMSNAPISGMPYLQYLGADELNNAKQGKGYTEVVL